MDMMDCGLVSNEVDLGLPHSLDFYTRDMMDCVLMLGEVDLVLPHSLQYLY